MQYKTATSKNRPIAILKNKLLKNASIVLFGLYAVIFPGNAKENPKELSGELPGQPLLQLQQQYQNARFISADFRQEKQVKFISQPLISQGQFQFADKAGLNWQIEQPFFARTLFVPQGVFKVTASGQSVEEKDRATLAIADLLQSLFSGRWQGLSEKFSVGKTVMLNNNRWQVTLTATDRWVKKAVTSIQLQGILKHKTAIEKITLRDGKNNLTTITLSHIVLQTTPLSDKQKHLFRIAGQ